MLDYVALTITSNDLEPAEVTAALGVEPTKAFRRGETQVHPTPTRFGYWRLKVRADPPADPTSSEVRADKAIEAVLDSLEGKEAVLAELAKEHNVDVTVVADLTNFTEGELDVGPGVLARIAAIGAELRLYWLSGTADPDE